MSSANEEEEEEEVAAAGWTTEKSPKGIEVLETEHSSRNVLAQYLHGIFPLHFPFEKFVFLRLAGGKEGTSKQRQTDSHIRKSPVVSPTQLFSHTSLKVDTDNDWFLFLFFFFFF